MPKCPPENLGFGKVLTDHMLKIKWSNAHGWHAPEITPAAPIPLHPFSHVFHYAQEVRIDKEGEPRRHPDIHSFVLPYAPSTLLMHALLILLSPSRSSPRQ